MDIDKADGGNFTLPHSLIKFVDTILLSHRILRAFFDIKQKAHLRSVQISFCQSLSLSLYPQFFERGRSFPCIQ